MIECLAKGIKFENGMRFRGNKKTEEIRKSWFKKRFKEVKIRKKIVKKISQTSNRIRIFDNNSFYVFDSFSENYRGHNTN